MAPFNHTPSPFPRKTEQNSVYEMFRKIKHQFHTFYGCPYIERKLCQKQKSKKRIQPVRQQKLHFPKIKSKKLTVFIFRRA